MKKLPDIEDAFLVPGQTWADCKANLQLITIVLSISCTKGECELRSSMRKNDTGFLCDLQNMASKSKKGQDPDYDGGKRKRGGKAGKDPNAPKRPL